MKEKMRIMILSPYDNSELRSHVDFKDYNCVVKFIVDKLGLATKTDNFKDIAPWVGNLISELEKRSDVELISVSPHIKLRNKIESFKVDKTTYYYYSSDYSSALRLIKNYKLWKRLQNCGKLVREIASEVRPDVIILFGTENPIISAPILNLTDYPVFCVLQTVYNKPDRAKYSRPSVFKQNLEMDILKHIPNYGTGMVYKDIIHDLNPNVNVLKYSWPSIQLPELPEQKKCYDFVNFAFTMDFRKGDEDSIRALALVKEKYPDVTLNITGGFTSKRKKYLEEIIEKLDLMDNVSFTPFFERHDDMLRHVMQARFAVLPIKLDLISTTIKEAMFYKLPVVTNATKGTPAINTNKQCVLLSEIGNIDSLAENMLALMQDDNIVESLKNNAFEYMLQRQDNTQKINELMGVLNAVYENKYYNKPIPQNLFV